jgi:hypothetical protein
MIAVKVSRLKLLIKVAAFIFIKIDDASEGLKNVDKPCTLPFNKNQGWQ